MNDLERISKLQQVVFKLIQRELKLDSHHKSYEGAIEIGLPGLYQDEFYIVLHCYVAGGNMGGRHHVFSGPTLEEAINKLEKEVFYWDYELTQREQDDG